MPQLKDLPFPPETADAEEWQSWWQEMVADMQITIAMIEKAERDEWHIPLDS